MPTTIEALVIVALVLSPGLIFTQLSRRVIAHVQEPTDVRFLLTIITAGTAIHGLIFPWTTRILDDYLTGDLPGHRWEAFAWALVTVFVAPLGLGVVAGRLTLSRRVEWLLDQIGLGYLDRMPSAWDYLMHQHRPTYVRVHLKDGQGFVGGIFANESFGSLNPQRADVYLEQAWQLDESGDFLQPVPASRGLWISQEVMTYVEIFEGVVDKDRAGATGLRRPPDHAAGHRQERGAADRKGRAVSAPPDASAAQEGRARHRRRR